MIDYSLALLQQRTSPVVGRSPVTVPRSSTSQSTGAPPPVVASPAGPPEVGSKGGAGGPLPPPPPYPSTAVSSQQLTSALDGAGEMVNGCHGMGGPKTAKVTKTAAAGQARQVPSSANPSSTRFSPNLNVNSSETGSSAAASRYLLWSTNILLRSTNIQSRAGLNLTKKSRYDFLVASGFYWFP